MKKEYITAFEDLKYVKWKLLIHKLLMHRSNIIFKADNNNSYQCKEK